jgi:hypothetical protein
LQRSLLCGALPLPLFENGGDPGQAVEDGCSVSGIRIKSTICVHTTLAKECAACVVAADREPIFQRHIDSLFIFISHPRTKLRAGEFHTFTIIICWGTANAARHLNGCWGLCVCGGCLQAPRRLQAAHPPPEVQARAPRPAAAPSWLSLQQPRQMLHPPLLRFARPGRQLQPGVRPPAAGSGAVLGPTPETPHLAPCPDALRGQAGRGTGRLMGMSFGQPELCFMLPGNVSIHNALTHSARATAAAPAAKRALPAAAGSLCIQLYRQLLPITQCAMCVAAL